MKAKILHKNDIYAEILVDEANGSSFDFLVYASEQGFYASNWTILEKDGKPHSEYDRQMIKSITHTDFDFRIHFDSYQKRSFSLLNDKDIKRMLSTLNEATDKEFKEHYAFALVCEFLCGFTYSQRDKYFDECLPWFTKFTSWLNAGSVDDILSQILGSLTNNTQKEIYAYTMSTTFTFTLKSEMVKWAKRYVAPRILRGEKGFEAFLKHYPVFDPETSTEGIELYEKYKGLGIDSAKLINYDIKHENYEKLYYHVMHVNACLQDEKERTYDLLYILRLLVLHGYQDKVKELAMRFLGYTQIAKNYYAFRAFISDEEMKKGIQDGLFDATGSYSPIFQFETNQEIFTLQDQRQQSRNSRYYYSSRPLQCFNYAYCSSIPDNIIDDYDLKYWRKETRQMDFYHPDEEKFFSGMAGLIRYHDKLSLRSLKDEASKPFINEAFLYLLKELAKEECSKNDENLHDYLGGK